MVKITVGNSYSKVQGLTVKQERELRDKLSYSVGSYMSSFQPRRVSLLGKKGDFPTGLLKHVLEFPDEFTINDLRIIPKSKDSIKIDLPHQPRQSQLDALMASLELERGIISKPTGSGKATIIALISAYKNVRTLVVVPTLELKQQLSNSLLGALKGKSDIVVENIDSPRLKELKDFDMLIIDEAHRSAAKTYRKLNKTVWNNIYYRYFLTATPFRTDPEEDLLLESIAGDVIYEQTYQEAVEAGEICPVVPFYINVPKQETDAFMWKQVYSELVVNNAIRNEIIAKTLLKLTTSNVSTLCLVKEVAHGRILAELTGLPFINGEDEESRRYIRQFSDGGIPAVIATEGLMAEGIDTRACEYVIIAGLGKSKPAFLQKCGRGVRRYGDKESAKVIIFRDPSNKHTLSHYRAQRKICIDYYSAVPLELEV